MQGYGLIIKPFDAGRLSAPEMAFALLHTHDLAAAGEMKALLRSFMGLQFRHLYCFLDFYFFDFLNFFTFFTFFAVFTVFGHNLFG